MDGVRDARGRAVGEQISIALEHCKGLRCPLAEQQRRVQRIAATLRRRFAADPSAEQVRLSLLTAFGALESGAERIDFALLQGAGFAQAMTTSEMLGMMRAQHQVTAVVQRLGKQGSLPWRCSATLFTPPVSVPLVIVRLFHRERVEIAFSPPVALSDVVPGFRLEGSQLLVSDVELYILGALGLLSPCERNRGRQRPPFPPAPGCASSRIAGRCGLGRREAPRSAGRDGRRASPLAAPRPRAGASGGVRRTARGATPT